MKSGTDELHMATALEAARAAGEKGEVPVGACVVNTAGNVLSIGFNAPITLSDPTAHAEIIALRRAAREVGNYRLTGCSLYTTIEPCVMCAGAIVNARISRLVFGAYDERFGAVRSRFGLCDDSSLNHIVEILGGVLEEECSALISGFFEGLRKDPRQR